MPCSTDVVFTRFGKRWRAVLCLAALGAMLPFAIARAQAPQPRPEAPRPVPSRPERPRPTVEQRRVFEERMMATHPSKTGCFEAHYPDEHWVETPCGPAPRHPNPHANGGHPNTVGAGTDWFATVTSGNISQTTGSFDATSGIANLYGFKPGDTTTAHPNVYAMQMNSNQFTTTVGGCNNTPGCAGWAQFIFSQSQCGASPCVFIEYWLLNYPNPQNLANPCPNNASWTWYPGGSGTTPGCYLNTPSKNLAAVPLSALGSLKMLSKVQGGNDIVTMSDSSGTLGSTSNPSIVNLGSGWTGVEYNLVGDCCNTESYFTGTTNASLTLRIATVNGTTNAPTCASSFNGTTAERNNLSLTGGCSPSGGAAPAIVFTESGGGPLPAGVTIGDPHLTTFHGAHYDFQHAGEYILAEADPDFQVQVRQVLITPPSKPAIAINVAAAVKMGPDRFAVTLKGTEVNGVARAIAEGQTIQLAGGVSVDHRGNTYTISRVIGDIVHITVVGDHVDVSVQIGATNAASVRGLLAGSPDQRHPFIGRDRQAITGPITAVALQRFVETWRVEPRESLFTEEGRPRPSGPIEALTLRHLDPAKIAEARKICTDRGVKQPTALDDCILDVSVMGRPELAERFMFAPKPAHVVHVR